MPWQGNNLNNPPNKKQENINRSEEKINQNRALNISRNTDTQKNFSISLKDIDTTIFNHLEKMQLSVIDNGNSIKLPIIYANSEKWKSIQKDKYMRDNAGKLLLPALAFYRSSTEMDKSMTSFNKNLHYPVMKLYSEKNQYTKFSLQTNSTRNQPINEVYSVSIPDYIIINYKFIVWTEYIEQGNSVIERINFDTNDYWGDAKNFRFRTYVDSYSHVTEATENNDRMVKTEFDLRVNSYLLPEQFSQGLDNYKSTTEKYFTKKKIIIGMETVVTDLNSTSYNENRDKWRSQHFPNLTIEDELELNNNGENYEI